MKMGILAINKAKDMTSHDVVSILRKKLNMKQIGHTGTLDPMATGLLLICIGRATKLSDYIMNQGKTYEAWMKLGQETTTYDSQGQIVNTSEKKNFTKEEIENVLENFRGKIKQVPPIYSAIKVQGKKLYDYARSGQDVEIKPRDVEIYQLDLLEIKEDKIKLRIACSKGTYIRSLIHDIGKALGTYAHMTDLVRTKSGPIGLENSLDTSQIEDYTKEDIFSKLLSPDQVLSNMETFMVDDHIKYRLVNGQRINIRDLENTSLLKNGTKYLIYNKETFLGIGNYEKNILKMEKLIWQE